MYLTRARCQRQFVVQPREILYGPNRFAVGNLNLPASFFFRLLFSFAETICPVYRRLPQRFYGDPPAMHGINPKLTVCSADKNSGVPC